MNKSNAITALNEILPNLQVDLIEVHLTQCRRDWRELDYVPAYNKIYFILEGEGWLKIGGREFRPAPGQLCLMPAHVRQSYSTVERGRPYLKYWCHFTADLGSADLFKWLDLPYVIDVQQQKRLAALFDEMIASRLDRSLSARFREKAALLELLSVLAEHAEVKQSGGAFGDADRLARISQFVEEHLHRPVTLEQMAKQVHLHPNYLIKYFNKHFNVPPMKYVNRKRIDRARLLLRTTSLSIKEIAAQVGFEDTNHFAKAFRRETSFSPSSYRANAPVGTINQSGEE